MELAEAREKHGHIFGCDAHASILDLDCNRVNLACFVICFDLNGTCSREFDRVFDQIYQHLFEAPCVANERWHCADFRLELQSFGRDDGREKAANVRDHGRHVKGILHQAEGPVFKLTQVEQVVDEGLQELELVQHHGAVADAKIYTLIVEGLSGEDFDDLAEEEHDGKEGRAHLVAHRRREVLRLRQELLPLLLLETKQFFVHLTRLVVDVHCDGRSPHIGLFLKAHAHIMRLSAASVQQTLMSVAGQGVHRQRVHLDFFFALTDGAFEFEQALLVWKVC